MNKVLNHVVVSALALNHITYCPRRQTEDAAAADLCASESVTIGPGKRALVKTGIAVALPSGTVGLICSRSGLALKHGVFVLNAPGVIDSDYRGELGVILFNAGEKPFEVEQGDRIAQLMVQPVLKTTFRWVDELPATERGEGGFGSTGVASK